MLEFYLCLVIIICHIIPLALAIAIIVSYLKDKNIDEDYYIRLCDYNGEVFYFYFYNYDDFRRALFSFSRVNNDIYKIQSYTLTDDEGCIIE